MLSIRRIGALGRTYRHLNRYRQILTILITYGFGEFIERLKIEQYIEIGLNLFSGQKREPHPPHKGNRAQRVRLALEELGPTYIKLGQLLSTRSDLIPVDFFQEFSKLQDQVPPFSFEEVRRVFEEDFGGAPDHIFTEFDHSPFASASIGQVHRARLISGETVAVKVQRPGIRKTTEVDLEIMLHLAMLMEHNIEEMALHRPVKIVEEFTRKMEKELDYHHEAANMERFSRQFMGDDSLHVPKVYGDISTERILVMEYIDGIKISDLDALKNAGLNLQTIVARGADLLLRQVFDYGFFHADPHPGNILVMPGNIICLLDFGLTGMIDRMMKHHFVDLIYSVVRGNSHNATQILLRLTSWESEPDPRLLEQDVGDFMGRYVNRPLKHIRIDRLLSDLLEVASRYRLRIPPDMFLMLKAFSSVEGIALMLDPNFDIVARAAPFIQREKLSRFHPHKLSEELFTLISDMLEFLKTFPKEALDILHLVKKKRLTVQFEHHGLEKLIETLERISNKLSLAIIIASLVIGSSIIVIAKIPPLFYGISFIGIIIFVTAAVMGLRLIVAILRKGRL